MSFTATQELYQTLKEQFEKVMDAHKAINEHNASRNQQLIRIVKDAEDLHLALGELQVLEERLDESAEQFSSLQRAHQQALESLKSTFVLHEGLWSITMVFMYDDMVYHLELDEDGEVSIKSDITSEKKESPQKEVINTGAAIELSKLEYFSAQVMVGALAGATLNWPDADFLAKKSVLYARALMLELSVLKE
jgi:hypothetical protein